MGVGGGAGDDGCSDGTAAVGWAAADGLGAVESVAMFVGAGSGSEGVGTVERASARSDAAGVGFDSESCAPEALTPSQPAIARPHAARIAKPCTGATVHGYAILPTRMGEPFVGTSKYIVSEELGRAVDVAAHLERPLLIKGEPGTGKTLLAINLAQARSCVLERWQVKSTTKAVEGLYEYDTVRRLHDSRFGEGDVHDIARYITLGPLGRAFESDTRRVVLIDEIDKADPEFPNDLLHELDTMSFTIPETGRTVTAVHRPIVVITSNNEKELPDAFLRRCVFHWIEFPVRELMARIVRVHLPDLEDELLSAALSAFYRLRDVDGLRKPPSTSELIDWLSALRHSGIDAAKLLGAGLPFLGTLLKKEQDIETLQRTVRRGRS